MSRRSERFLLIPCAALLWGLFACGGGGGATTTAAPPPAADFSLQVTPGSLQVPAGGSGYVMVTLSRLNGFSAPVTLSGLGFPSGVVVGGTLSAGATSLQVPVAVAPGVSPSVYTGLSLRGQAGTLVHDAAFSLTVAQALPPSHLRDDLVQAAGGRQAGGAYENQAVLREGLPAQTVRDAGDSTRVRHGFYPSGIPTDH